MSIPVLIIGRSGSGKTYSIKNFKSDEVGVISVEKGRLPFKSDIKTIRVPKYEASADVNTYAQANANWQPDNKAARFRESYEGQKCTLMHATGYTDFGEAETL